MNDSWYDTNANVFETVFAIALLVGLAAFFWWVVKNPFWRARMKELIGNKGAMVALAVASLYFLIAWSDMVRWETPDLPDDAPLEARMSRSLLDRVFAQLVGAPEWEYKEKSYSAPVVNKTEDGWQLGFATREFVDTEIKLTHRHLLGTDRVGRDTLYQILKGCKPAVLIGTLPLIVSIPLAVFMGIVAGFFGGRIDDFIVYLYSTLASIPGLLLLLALVAVLGQGLPQIAFGLGVTGWVGLCRLTRGETLKLREMEYVAAAKCLGVSKMKTIFVHILPNLGHLVIITAVLAFTGLVLTESVLAYLGLGLDHSWGGLIDNARAELSRDPVIWWNLLFASVALLGLVLAVNVLGDALRDALDPRVNEVKK